MESIDDLILTNRQAQTNERTSKYTAPPNPQGDCPRSIQSLAINYQKNTTWQPGQHRMVFLSPLKEW